MKKIDLIFGAAIIIFILAFFTFYSAISQYDAKISPLLAQFAFVMMSSVITFSFLYVTYKYIQESSWERDMAFKRTYEIYGHIDGALENMLSSLRKFHFGVFHSGVPQGWKTVRENSALFAIARVHDSKLLEDLTNFFEKKIPSLRRQYIGLIPILEKIIISLLKKQPGITSVNKVNNTEIENLHLKFLQEDDLGDKSFSFHDKQNKSKGCTVHAKDLNDSKKEFLKKKETEEFLREKDSLIKDAEDLKKKIEEYIREPFK